MTSIAARVCLLPMALLCVLAGVRTADARQNGSIRVHVTDPAGTGIPGASVSLGAGRPPVTTDAGGRVTLPNVPPGDHEVTAAASGTIANRAKVTVRPGQSPDVTIVLGGDSGHDHEYAVLGPGIVVPVPKEKKRVIVINACLCRAVGSDFTDVVDTGRQENKIQGQITSTSTFTGTGVRYSDEEWNAALGGTLGVQWRDRLWFFAGFRGTVGNGSITSVTDAGSVAEYSGTLIGGEGRFSARYKFNDTVDWSATTSYRILQGDATRAPVQTAPNNATITVADYKIDGRAIDFASLLSFQQRRFAFVAGFQTTLPDVELKKFVVANFGGGATSELTTLSQLSGTRTQGIVGIVLKMPRAPMLVTTTFDGHGAGVNVSFGFNISR